MTTAADLLPAALALFGGGALGAAVGGALLFRSSWAGARLQAALATFACVGAGLGLIAAFGLPLPALAFHLPRLTPPTDDEEIQRVLKTYYPDDYAAAKATMDTMKATGASDAQIAGAMRKAEVPLLRRQLPLASTENALAYIDVANDEQRFMASRPELCYAVAVETSPQGLDALRAAMPDDLREREAHLEIKLLEQTATAPQPPHMTDELKDKLKIWAIDAVNGLSFEDRDALTQGGAQQGKAACEAVGNFLNNLALMGGSDAVEAFKELSVRGLGRLGD